MHVRRGDYHGTRRFSTLPAGYYVAGAARIAAEQPGTRLVVFSDDPGWCRETLAPELERVAEVTVVEGNPDWADLFLIARCDRHVLSNSTFASWGAFLSGDPAPCYPRPFTRDPLRDEGMFPASWQPLDV